jgi:hypothetical protein
MAVLGIRIRREKRCIENYTGIPSVLLASIARTEDVPLTAKRYFVRIRV